MSAITSLIAESPWLRLVPGTASGTEISALGTLLDFTRAAKVVATFAGAAASEAAKTKYHTTDGANGYQFSVEDISTNINVVTGLAISEEATTTTDKFECSVLVDSAAQRTTLNNLYKNGTPVWAVREVGKNAETNAIAGYEYIFGVVSDLKENTNKGVHSMDFSIVGKTFGAGKNFTIATTSGTANITYSSFAAAVSGGSHTITPIGEGGARTITDIVTGDWTILATGKIVTKDVV